ncbi:MAG: DUF4282 domain-containing protein [Candidatus Pacebacteria bacterium]|nr:DUF4282 domain-containing protein [Candidatus Paceibacterota bacterium]
MSKKIFLLDEMLTPKIITFVYWLMLLAAIFSGLSTMFTRGFTLEKFITGLLLMLSIAIGARIWCELLIVVFKIHENLKKIADKTDKGENN